MSKANLVGKEDDHIKKKKLICEETVWTYSLRDPHSSTFQGPLCKESRYRQKHCTEQTMRNAEGKR